MCSFLKIEDHKFLDHHAIIMHVFHHSWYLQLTVWLKTNMLKHFMMSQIYNL